MISGTKLRVAVLLSGSGTNLQAIINQVESNELDIDIVGIVSDNPDAFGLERARKAGLATIVVDYALFPNRKEYDAELENTLARLEPDLVVLAGYMRILATPVVNAYAGRMLNIHPSLLPAYPGLDTYRRALEAGEDWHGTTVHYVIPELDAGPAILQYRIRIGPDDTEDQLCERIQNGEYRIYSKVISWIAAGRLQLRDGKVVMDGSQIDTPLIEDEPQQSA
ncbi:MAG: phosphoribosylglycinamide formyltransferase [Gammaproteobacteria bacterium]|jgi:phosphoribosylglycinamide formyltransferase-1|nr:phosphoribosylglycinamide formyltransferase [Gammaproteobacteria bacterium]MDP6617011.1 phosphoribosylglycinamide formyltransferase [Gammaproteobacteria bacterium]MDP6695097.1 phosphoribosylglycinamide formyltransferase [Gammaproteobacteria bacterium]MDP7042223.1 phosphoribosylglycinamide formyltransferase [Gammaproteobacteria bacterium]